MKILDGTRGKRLSLLILDESTVMTATENDLPFLTRGMRYALATELCRNDIGVFFAKGVQVREDSKGWVPVLFTDPDFDFREDDGADCWSIRWMVRGEIRDVKDLVFRAMGAESLEPDAETRATLEALWPRFTEMLKATPWR